jgi:hypothetical protein
MDIQHNKMGTEISLNGHRGYRKEPVDIMNWKQAQYNLE